MNHSDVAAIMKGIAPVLRDYVAGAITPILARLAETEKALAKVNAKIAALESVELPKAPDADEVKGWVDVAVSAIPVPKDGASVTLEDVRPLILEAVGEAVSALPAAKDGVDGKSVSVEDVAPLIADLVSKAVAEIPVPKDGRDGIDGKDGVGLASALIDNQGQLVVTMTDGTVKQLGRVNGQDGAPGCDGLGFDDLSVEHDGERGVTFRFARGDVVKEFSHTLPAIIDRGVYKEGQAYARGDAVTWGGNLWIAQRDTDAKPADNNADWRLAVRKGRDGLKGDPGRSFDGSTVKAEPKK